VGAVGGAEGLVFAHAFEVAEHSRPKLFLLLVARAGGGEDAGGIFLHVINFPGDTALFRLIREGLHRHFTNRDVSALVTFDADGSGAAAEGAGRFHLAGGGVVVLGQGLCDSGGSHHFGVHAFHN
jgi:hypothetical protein